MIQENTFNNLSYGYSVSHLPLYAAIKSQTRLKDERYSLLIDAGLGPNFMNIRRYQEHSIGANTLPDHAFKGNANTTLSATLGASLRMNEVFGQAPLECGYRFFYLGQGSLSPHNTEITQSLKTGQNYANALTCSVAL